MSPEQPRCCFCQTFTTAQGNAPWDTVLHDSGNFLVLPTRGALVPGWLLVIAKRHALCVGALSGAELDELTGCLATARSLVQENFGSPTIFEHGPSQAGTSLGCGVDHMHLHVAPLKFSLRKAVNSSFPQVKWQPLPDISATRSLFEAQTDYGLVKEPTEETIYWCSPPTGVTQIFRRVIAAEIDTPDEFDYRTYPQFSNVAQTLAVLSQAPDE
jgi:ATP adenylyltransferase